MSKVSDNKKFCLAVFLCVSGVALLFVGVLVEASIGLVLGGAGEVFTLAGAIIGVDAYFTRQIKDIVNDVMNGKDERK